MKKTSCPSPLKKKNLDKFIPYLVPSAFLHFSNIVSELLDSKMGGKNTCKKFLKQELLRKADPDEKEM